jgi:hypothetical protein
MPTDTSPRWRNAAVGASLLAVLGVALTVPIPAASDTGREQVRREIRYRLPGWEVQRIDPSWEGAYTVVTTCAGLELGFQYVLGHGLAPDDAWIQPNDGYSRQRLRPLSDHWRYLVWYSERRDADRLSCHEELARVGEPPAVPRSFD